MHGTLLIQTDDDFSVYYKGEWMYESTVVIQIESIDDLKDLDFDERHRGSGKSDGVRENIRRVIEHPDCYYDSTGGNRGILWSPKATKSPTLRDIINQHLPFIRHAHPTFNIDGLDDITVIDNIIKSLIVDLM